LRAGGGWCWDAATCAARGPSWTSSKAWKPRANLSGIFAAADPLLRDANLVFVPYCTSDAHIGASDAPFSFPFRVRGRAVVDATFSSLVSLHGLGAAAGTQLLFTGCSAGARGALFNMDHVLNYVRGLIPAPSNVARYGGLLDSAFWVDLAPLDPSATPFPAQARAVYTAFNVSAGILSAACTAAYPSAPWKCLVGEYAVPMLQSPYLLHAYQYDAFQLGGDWGLPFMQARRPHCAPHSYACCVTCHMHPLR
jgi:O-palmitoleoyl-L-serine hydrolase